MRQVCRSLSHNSFVFVAGYDLRIQSQSEPREDLLLLFDNEPHAEHPADTI